MLDKLLTAAPVTMSVSIMFFILLAGIVITIGFKERFRRKKYLSAGISDLPVMGAELESLSPSLIAQFLDGRGESSRHLTAGLLSLVRKEHLLLKYDEEKTEYFFEDNLNNTTELPKDEKFLYDWFIYDIGDNRKFYPSDLQEYTANNENREAFIHKYYEWEETNEIRLKELGYFSSVPTRKIILGAMAGIFVVTGSILLFFLPFISILYLLGALISFWLMVVQRNITDVGWENYYRWEEYKKKLSEEPGKELNDPVIFPVSALYAIAFGIKEEYIKHLTVREAAPSLRQGNFPLYFSTGTGGFILSKEGMDSVDDIEASMENAIFPVGEADNSYEGDTI